MKHTIRIAIEVSTPDGALLPGQAVRVWDRRHRLVDAYRIRMHLAPFLDGKLLTVKGPVDEPRPDDRTMLASPGAFITLTPTPGFEPGLHGWSHVNYAGGRSFEQQPISVGDYVQAFTGRKQTRLRTTLPHLITEVKGGLGRVWDMTGQRSIFGRGSEIPFCLGPVEDLVQATARLRDWTQRARELVPGALYLHRPGPYQEGRMSMDRYRSSFTDFEYLEREYDRQAWFYPGPSRLEILQFLDRATRPAVREPQGFRDSGPLSTNEEVELVGTN